MAMRRIRVAPVLEFRFDAVSNAVEELMTSLRNNEEYIETDESSVQSMEGWAEDDVDSPALFNQNQEERVVPSVDDGPLDAHPFASRRKQATHRERPARKRSRNTSHARKGSNPHRRRDVPFASESAVPQQHDGDHINRTELSDCDGSIEELGLPRRSETSSMPIEMDHGNGVDRLNPSHEDKRSERRSRRRVRSRKQKRRDSPTQSTQGSRRRQQHDQEPMANRMERWIEHNEENFDNDDEKHGVADSDGPSRLRDAFFRHFHSHTDLVTVSNADSSSRSSRPTTSFRRVVPNSRRVALSLTTQSTTEAPISNALQCSTLLGVVQALESDGCRTLQDHVSSKGSGLPMFISLLRTALRLMKNPGGFDDSPESDRLRKIFEEDGGAVFLEAVALQVTDTTMSMFNPQAWALKNVNANKILSQLVPLWADLSLHGHPVEMFVRCVLKTQHPQKWRLVRDGDHVFVSCVDPDDWKEVILSGTPMKQPKNCRISGFTNVLPRCEVDCMWGIVAFLAKTSGNTCCGESQTIQWDLISTLFLRSSLAADEHHLPPSPDQLRSVLKDLRSFSSLLVEKSFGGLPKRDKLLISLIEKSFSLEAEYLERENLPLWQNSDGSLVISASFFRGDSPSRPNMNASNREFSLKEIIVDLSGDNTPVFLNAPFLMPSSTLVRVCLGLIACWRCLLPSAKPKRVQFFHKAVRMLIQAIVASHSKSDKENEGIQRDSFLGAFSLRSSKTNSIGSPCLHYMEACAFISVFSCLPMRLCDDKAVGASGFLDDTWKLISGERSLNESSFRIDSSERLELSTKWASFLVASLFHETGTFSDDPRLPLSVLLFRPLHVSDGHHDSVLLKLVAYLSVCMNSASGSEIDVTATARVTARVTFALEGLQKRLHKENAIQISLSLSRLGLEQVPLSTTGQLIRKIVQLPDVGPDGEDCIRTTCSLIRVLMSIITFVRNDPTSPLYSEAIDVDGHTSKSESPEGKEGGDLVAFLSACLCLSTPSKRFNIDAQDFPEEEVTMSAAGRQLISHTMKAIVECIVTIITSCKLDVPPMLLDWMESSGPPTLSSLDGDNDDQYKRRVAFQFAQSLCRAIRRSSIPAGAVAERKTSFISCFILSSMDIKLLRKVPSMNINQMGSRGGNGIEEKAFSEFLDFSTHSNTSLRRYLSEIREYATNLSYCLKACGAIDFCAILDTFGQLTSSDDLPHSLELELRDRFRLICMVLCQASSTRTCLDASHLGCQLLGTMCWNVIFLLEKLEILDKTVSDIGGDNYRRSKLFETLRAMIETLIGCLALVCRIYSSPGLPNDSALSKVFMHLCNSLILPICQENSTDVKNCLRKAVELASLTDPHASRQTNSTLNNFDPAVEQLFRASFIRRSKEVFVGLSGSAILMRSHLLAAIIAATNASTATKICAGLSSVDSWVRSNEASPLQQSLAWIYQEIEESYPLPQPKINAFRSLRQTMLESHILQMLNSKNPQNHLEFFIGLIDSCVDRPLLKLNTLCRIMRAITTIARTAVREGSSQLLCTVVRCVLCLARLPAGCVDIRATGWLLDWASSNDCSNREAAFYWLVFQYHDAFFKMLQGMASNEVLPQATSSWPVCFVEGRLDDNVVNKLQTLDRELYGEIAPINNVYRKQVSKAPVSVSACQTDEFQRLRQQVTELCQQR